MEVDIGTEVVVLVVVVVEPPLGTTGCVSSLRTTLSGVVAGGVVPPVGVTVVGGVVPSTTVVRGSMIGLFGSIIVCNVLE